MEHSIEGKLDKDGNLVMTGLTTVIDDKETKAKQKRHENKAYDKYKNHNPYTRGAMNELITGEPSKVVNATDFAIDLIPTLGAFILSKGIKHSDKYQGAKLRKKADTFDYKWTPQNQLELSDGSITTDSINPLRHAIYKSYNGVEIDKKIEKELKKLAAKYKKLGVDAPLDAWKSMYSNFIDGAFDKYKKGEDLITDDILKTFEKLGKIDKKTKDIIGKEIQFDGQRIKNKPGDTAVLKAPSVINTLGAVNAADSLLKDKPFGPDLSRAPAPEEQLRRLKENEGGGLTSTGLPTLTEIIHEIDNNFFGGTLKYNRKEAIKETDKIFDYIQENGTEEQLKKAYEIYGNTNFDNKKEAVKALRELLVVALD